MSNSPAITLYYHPFSRAANVVWMLEELGLPYQLEYVELAAGKQKDPEILGRSPMGKVPLLIDGETVVSESAAIGLYLADRYSYGELAPNVDDPARAAYLRWSFFAPAVIEPGCMAKSNNWQARKGTAGWGEYEAMLDTIEFAIGEGPWLLGNRFSMVDVIFGGTVRFMLQFKMLEARPSFVAYAERLSERAPCLRANEKNAEEIKRHNLGQ